MSSHFVINSCVPVRARLGGAYASERTTNLSIGVIARKLEPNRSLSSIQYLPAIPCKEYVRYGT